jgi:hypothetical protein
MAKVSLEIDREGPITILLHPKSWNWTLRRQTLAWAKENAQILAIQGEFVLWISRRKIIMEIR